MKLPVISGEKVITVLRRIEYQQIRQRGSHVVMQKTVYGKTQTVVVPMHKELTKGTLRSIIRQVGLTMEEFINLLEK
jgi:predicted RNA binding protein YcfA (HicA-like mRNA interferase family)